ncbi:hypothetical protein F2Q69_00060444 [Brassica cretica]|uniref:Uncharacterized protein n=1 Tax=Brassica cretica TaxID=69181 RepID=A0A8S9RB97_BRACR|nr:hypothetical protein F2Q69_00060444 [Brassica cretica]
MVKKTVVRTHKIGSTELRSTTETELGSDADNINVPNVRVIPVPIDDIAMAGGRKRLRNLASRNSYGSTPFSDSRSISFYLWHIIRLLRRNKP